MAFVNWIEDMIKRFRQWRCSCVFVKHYDPKLKRYVDRCIFCDKQVERDD